MRARVVIVISMWVSAVVGAARLSGHTGGVSAIAFAGVPVVALVLATRDRRRRLRRWNAPRESAFPAGPRRVPLLETGLDRP